MHQNLNDKRHSPECQVIIDEYKECLSQRSAFEKSIYNVCGDLHIAVTKCLRKQLENNRKAHTEESKNKRLKLWINNDEELKAKVERLKQLQNKFEKKQ
ncbi:hypothetical protein GJ496_009522 [Pomphorhynchus laevis]|nr:hypothetical protein GJ496_009522 [Pomphorhynchus laevis]